MKLTNLQRETIVKNIYDEIKKSQNEYIELEINKQFPKRISDYKKSPEYKEYLKIEQVDNIKGVSVSLESDSIFYAETKNGWRCNLKSVEELVEYKLRKEISSTIKDLDQNEIERKLILATISGFDFEEFKKTILDEFII